MEEQQATVSQAPVNKTSSMTTKVMKGSFWVLMGQVLPLAATFVASPFVIRSLGSEAYGVLILVGLISSYFSFADFGMVMASTRFGSEAYANETASQEGRVVRTAALIGVGSSLFIALPLFFFSGWVVGDLLSVPVYLQKQAGIALKITSVAFVLSFVSNIFNTPQLSRMRMDLNVLINSGLKILMTLATPVVLYFGGGIIEATIVSGTAVLLMMIGNLYVSGKLLPGLFHWSIDQEKIRPLLKFGGNIVIYAIGLAVINNLEKFLLTKFVSVKSLAYYSVASTFANMTTMFSMAMVQTLIPAFSQLLTPEKRGQLTALFTRTVRISLLGLIPSVMVLLIIAKPFFTLWAGAEFGIGSMPPFYILLIGIFFSILVYIPNCVLMAAGRSGVFAKVYILEVLPYGLITYFLVRELGIIGAALALALKEVVNAMIFIRFTEKYTGLTFKLSSYQAGMIQGLLAFVPAVLFAFLYDNFSLWLILLVPSSFVLYCYIAWKKMITDEEKIWLITKWKQFKFYKL